MTNSFDGVHLHFSCDTRSAAIQPRTDGSHGILSFSVRGISFFEMASTGKVLIIQHSKGVRPAYVTTFFTENKIPYEILLIFDEDARSTLPANDTDDYAAIVSLGGPQATYEDDEYPYLKWEKTFLAAQLHRRTPILGICLGAQLMADAIGGHGHLGKHGYELGYVDYELTADGKHDPVISKVFAEQENRPLLIMHHMDSFDLPAHASILAYTSKRYIAAYRIGSALCVQFHPEASFVEFNEWVQRTRRHEPQLYGDMNVDEILRRAQESELRAARSRRLFFETWWTSLAQ